MATNITVADGQVAATTTTIIAGTSNNAERVTVLLNNTGGNSETIIVTLTRSGSTARRIFYGVLDPNEAVHLRGIPLSQGDVLAGYTSNASAVDYLVSVTPESTQLAIQKYDATGSQSSAPAILEQLAQLLGN